LILGWQQAEVKLSFVPNFNTKGTKTQSDNDFIGASFSLFTILERARALKYSDTKQTKCSKLGESFIFPAEFKKQWAR
jgi:hypothetical protein